MDGPGNAHPPHQCLPPKPDFQLKTNKKRNFIKAKSQKEKKLIMTKYQAFNHAHQPLMCGPCLSTLINHCHYCTASPVLMDDSGSWFSWLSVKQHNSKDAQQATVEFFPFYVIKTSFSFGMSLSNYICLFARLSETTNWLTTDGGHFGTRPMHRTRKWRSWIRMTASFDSLALLSEENQCAE